MNHSGFGDGHWLRNVLRELRSITSSVGKEGCLQGSLLVFKAASLWVDDPLLARSTALLVLFVS